MPHVSLAAQRTVVAMREQMMHYLSRSPCVVQSEEQIASFVQQTADLPLTTSEILQCINLRPEHTVEVYLVRRWLARLLQRPVCAASRALTPKPPTLNPHAVRWLWRRSWMRARAGSAATAASGSWTRARSASPPGRKEQMRTMATATATVRTTAMTMNPQRVLLPQAFDDPATITCTVIVIAVVLQLCSIYLTAASPSLYSLIYNYQRPKLLMYFSAAAIYVIAECVYTTDVSYYY